MASISMKGGISLVITTFALAVWQIPHTWAQDSVGEDPRKEIARGRYTEFCAAVRAPVPSALAELVNSVTPNDLKKWLPVVNWLNAINAGVLRNGCGEL